MPLRLAIGLILILLPAVDAASAEGLRERVQRARDASRQASTQPVALPAGTRVLRDVAYGRDPRQRFDAYLPARPSHDAPVILFVHGGGWANGNKDNPGVVEGKAARWLPEGWILVSTNYRMRPDTAPVDQARDVARALARVQRLAPDWGADPARVVLVGHSAGAHLAALVGASDTLWREARAGRPLAVVSLDSGALDVPDMMRRPRLPPLYHRAFGPDPDDWVEASPQHRLAPGAVPMLLVCSTRRNDACPQAEALRARAASLGVAMEVLPQDLSHAAVNRELGWPSAYTDAVDRWLDARLR
ncbi:alpha/beta hydrolase [Pseudoxanthomonas sp. 10H]|uniref:alpha/beta hydrolase n=1 Tax=Pseudoxanthomonas sp. 10H TaxID=3242729 RepID=UPI003558565B